MNKILFLSVVVLVAVSSCKKDHTCTCTKTGFLGVDAVISDTIINGTRRKAKEECSNLGKDEGLVFTICELE